MPFSFLEFRVSSQTLNIKTKKPERVEQNTVVHSSSVAVAVAESAASTASQKECVWFTRKERKSAMVSPTASASAASASASAAAPPTTKATAPHRQQQQTKEYKQLPLFGDCMSALIPLEWLDVSDYRPVPDNQEMFSDFDSESPAMICVEIVERVGDDVTGVNSEETREEDNLAKFYLEDLKELMDATSSSSSSSESVVATKDWRYELSSSGKEEKLRAVFVDGRAFYVRGAAGNSKEEVTKKMKDLSLTLPKDEAEEEEERVEKQSKKDNAKDNDDDDNEEKEEEEEEDDYVKNKCEWISFAEERNCLVPSKDEDGNDSTRSVTISMYAHRLEKKYDTDILISFVRPSKSDRSVGTDDETEETEDRNHPGAVAQQTLRMLDWSLLGFDEEDEEEEEEEEEESLE